jgi:DNA polymerase III delta subunit
MARKQKSTVSVFFGGESYFLDSAVEEARAGGSVVLDGDSITVSDFIRECQSVPVSVLDGTTDDFAIVLDNAQELKGKELKAFLDEFDGTGLVLTVVLRSDKIPDVWKPIEGKGKVHHYPKFKPWDTSKVVDAVSSIATKLGVAAEDPAIELLVARLGNSLHLAASELRKLSWVLQGAVLTRQVVAASVVPIATALPFEAAEAACNKSPKRALNLAAVLYEDMGDGVSVPIVSALLTQIERLLVVRDMLDRKEPPKIIALRLDAHSFRVDKHYIPMARKHTTPALKEMLEHICKLDVQVKTGHPAKRTLVELALLRIATTT